LGLEAFEIIIIFSIVLATTLVIKYFQNIPTGKIGFVEIILGDHDPALKIKSISFIFLVPIAIGVIPSALLSSSPFISGTGTAIGSFLTVSTAFFHPKLLAPPLQDNLFKTRLFYSLFVMSYGVLGFSGGLLVNLIRSLSDTTASGFASGMLIFLVSVTLTFGAQILSRPAFKQDLYIKEHIIRQRSESLFSSDLSRTIEWELRNLANEIAASTAIQNMHANDISHILKESLEQLPILIQLSREYERSPSGYYQRYDNWYEYESTPYSYPYQFTDRNGYTYSSYYEDNLYPEPYQYYEWRYSEGDGANQGYYWQYSNTFYPKYFS